MSCARMCVRHLPPPRPTTPHRRFTVGSILTHEAAHEAYTYQLGHHFLGVGELLEVLAPAWMFPRKAKSLGQAIGMEAI